MRLIKYIILREENRIWLSLPDNVNLNVIEQIFQELRNLVARETLRCEVSIIDHLYKSKNEKYKNKNNARP
jgi:hypothetical protein